MEVNDTLLNRSESAMNILRYLEQKITKSMMPERFSAQSHLENTADNTHTQFNTNQSTCVLLRGGKGYGWRNLMS